MRGMRRLVCSQEISCISNRKIASGFGERGYLGILVRGRCLRGKGPQKLSTNAWESIPCIVGNFCGPFPRPQASTLASLTSPAATPNSPSNNPSASAETKDCIERSPACSLPEHTVPATATAPPKLKPLLDTDPAQPSVPAP